MWPVSFIFAFIFSSTIGSWLDQFHCFHWLLFYLFCLFLCYCYICILFIQNQQGLCYHISDLGGCLGRMPWWVSQLLSMWTGIQSSRGLSPSWTHLASSSQASGQRGIHRMGVLPLLLPLLTMAAAKRRLCLAAAHCKGQPPRAFFPCLGLSTTGCIRKEAPWFCCRNWVSGRKKKALLDSCSLQGTTTGIELSSQSLLPQIG